MRRRMPVFVPGRDPDLFYWFDAADTSTLKGSGGAAITDGATVYEWLNKGSSPAKMVQSSPYGRPIWRPNSFGGHPGVVFNGNQVLGANDRNGFNGLDGLTVVVACVQTGKPGTSGGRPFHISGGSAQATLLHVALDGYFIVRWGVTRMLAHFATGMDLGTWSVNKPVISTASIDFGQALLSGYLDGVFCQSLEYPHGPGVTDWGVPYTVTIGAQHSAGGFWWGFIGPIFEVMLWHRALTQAELFPVHHYLRTKWQIEPSPDMFGEMMAPTSEPYPYWEEEGEVLLYGPDGEPLI